MQEAANIANEDELMRLIGKLGSEHAAIANALTSLVRDFAFDLLVDLTAGA